MDSNGSNIDFHCLPTVDQSQGILYQSDGVCLYYSCLSPEDDPYKLNDLMLLELIIQNKTHTCHTLQASKRLGTGTTRVHGDQWDQGRLLTAAWLEGRS